MNDEDAGRLADIVSERVFLAMEKFVEALEEVVRDNERMRERLDYVTVHNEQLHAKVGILEAILRGPDGGDDDDDVCDANCGCRDEGEDLEDADEDGFFDVLEPEPEEDDEPMFD